MLHLELGALDWSTYNEYSYRIILLLLLLYVLFFRAHPYFPSQFRKRRLQRFFFTSSANTPKTWWEGNFPFLAEGK